MDMNSSDAVLVVFLHCADVLLSKEHTHIHSTVLQLWILSGTTRVSGYKKKHSPAHTYPRHQ